MKSGIKHARKAPKDFTPDGKAKMDEEILNTLPYPEAKLLSKYFVIQKRIGMLAEGAQAWLKQEKNKRISKYQFGILLAKIFRFDSSLIQKGEYKNLNLKSRGLSLTFTFSISRPQYDEDPEFFPWLTFIVD